MGTEQTNFIKLYKKDILALQKRLNRDRDSKDLEWLLNYYFKGFDGTRLDYLKTVLLIARKSKIYFGGWFSNRVKEIILSYRF